MGGNSFLARAELCLLVLFPLASALEVDLHLSEVVKVESLFASFYLSFDCSRVFDAVY